MNTAHISIKDLSMGYGSFMVQEHLCFDINHKDIFIIMGGSGCGKSTLLRHLIGLQRPCSGKIFFKDKSLWDISSSERKEIMKQFGVLYQKGALWSSMTLAENIALPMEEHTRLKPADIRDRVSFKLALVGLSGFENYYPSEISGGMQKRAALARAMALDPDILFFDEPSAGLDPVSSRRLDDLILELNESLGATIVMVTHELASIFATGTNSVFLDAKAKTMIASGRPRTLLESETNAIVRAFLTRGQEGMA